MQKAHVNQNWQNKPSINTPINETNLNKLDRSVDTIDDRVITLDTTKANLTDMLVALKNITFDRATGVFTITKFNNTSFTIDTDLEKIAVNFDYDDDPTSPHYQNLILTLIDGTVKYIDLSALITQFEFVDTSTIHFSLGADGKIYASIINGSITEDMLQPNFLAECRTEVSKATQQADLSNSYRRRSEAYAVGTIDGIAVPNTDPAYKNSSKDWKETSEAYAVGKRNGVDVGLDDETHNNNSKFYSEQSKEYSDLAEESAQDAADSVVAINNALRNVTFSVNFETGNLEYDDPRLLYSFTVNETTGNLEWEVVA